MRFRQTNKEETPTQHAKSLISSDDVLSTREQEEVLRYFATTLRCSTRFLQVVAVLHFVLALVYTMLLLAGSPLVYTVMDSRERDMLASLQHVVEEAHKPQPVEHDISTIDELQKLQEALRQGQPMVNRALDERRRQAAGQVVTDFLSERGGTKASMLTVGSGAAMLWSIALFIIGGFLCLRTCRALRVDVEALVNTSPSDGKARRAAAAAAAAAASADKKKEGAMRTLWLRLMQRVNPSGSHAAYQLLLASLSVWPTAYWVLTMAWSHHRLNRLYGELGLGDDSKSLWLGVTDNLAELLLVLWQPVFHGFLAYMVLCMFDTREKLHSLADLKYSFEKI